jgi:hypothetical protein
MTPRLGPPPYIRRYAASKEAPGRARNATHVHQLTIGLLERADERLDQISLLGLT